MSQQIKAVLSAKGSPTQYQYSEINKMSGEYTIIIIMLIIRIVKLFIEIFTNSTYSEVYYILSYQDQGECVLNKDKLFNNTDLLARPQLTEVHDTCSEIKVIICSF